MLPKIYNYQNNQVYLPFQNNELNQPSQNYKVNQTYRQLQSDEVPGPNFENPDPCLLEVAKSVCKIRIDTNNGTYICGTGFFLKFLINERFYHWLVTNEHVITKEMINNKKEFDVSFNIERKK